MDTQNKNNAFGLSGEIASNIQCTVYIWVICTLYTKYSKPRLLYDSTVEL